MNNPADMEHGHEASAPETAEVPETVAKEDPATEKSIYDMFETDASLESKGIIVDYGKAGKFLVARAGGSNKSYARVVERIMRPHRRQFELGTLDPDVALELAHEIFAEAVVLEWEGVRNRERELIPCNQDNVVQLFKDLPELFLDIQDFASKAANFLLSELEGDAKN